MRRRQRMWVRTAAVVGGRVTALALGGCGADRSAETAEQIRITPGAGGRAGSEVDVTLVGVTAPIRSGLTHPVTFVFERAGELSMELPVEVPSNVPAPRADQPQVDASGVPATGAPR